MGFRAGRAFVLAELPDVDSVASNAAAEGADAELLDVAFGPDSVSLMAQVSSGEIGAPSSLSQVTQVSSSKSSTAGAAPMAYCFRFAGRSRQLYAMSVWMAARAAILRFVALGCAWLAMAWAIWAKVCISNSRRSSISRQTWRGGGMPTMPSLISNKVSRHICNRRRPSLKNDSTDEPPWCL